MAALGAELVFVGNKDSNRPSTVLRRATARRIADEDPSAWWPDQHNNPHNPAGYAGLAHELGDQLPEGVDVLVAAVGTGGTLCGTTNRLREMGHTAETIGVEPEGSIIFGDQLEVTNSPEQVLPRGSKLVATCAMTSSTTQLKSTMLRRSPLLACWLVTTG